MKKNLLFILAALLLLTACGKNETEAQTKDAQTQTSENRLSQIKNSKELVIGTNANYPPFEYHIKKDGNDEISGFDIMIAKEIAKDLGVELVIEDMDFSAVLAGIETGVIDLGIAGINNTPDREKVMDFSDVYYESNYTVIVKKGDTDKFNTKEKLEKEQATVGVQTATVQEGIAKEIDGIKITSLPKTPDLILQLKSGMLDCIITENTVADLYAAQNDDLESDKNGNFSGESGACIAAQKGQDELLKEVNKTIERLKDEEKIEEFYNLAIDEYINQEQ